MTRTLIGLDYQGAPCLKITKGDLDPVTTPDDTLGAFLFNSKDTIQTKLNKVEITSTDASNGIYPAGSDTTNFQRYRFNYENRYFGYNYQRSFFQGLDFTIPLTDFVIKNTAGWYLKGRQLAHEFIGNQNSDIGWCRMVYPNARGGIGEAGWKINCRTIVYGWLNDGRPSQLYPELLHFINVIDRGSTGSVEMVSDTFTDVVVWNLPGNNEALPQKLPSQPGQRSIRIDRNGLKIAKSGFDVDVASLSQMAVSSDLRPTKIVAADDIVVPAGNSEYLLPVAVPANSICDIQYYTGDELVYPGLPRTNPVGANWKLLSDRIQFQNAGIACRARFVVIVNDQVGQTVGDNEVFRQFEVNGENVVQFLRPGAANPPAFADIIIDSRWPALRILKEGYFEVAAGAQITNVPIDTTGYYPFVKFMVTCAGSGDAYSASIRPPTVGMYKLNANGDNGWKETGDTTYAKVTANNVAFHSFRGRPKYFYWIYNSTTGWRLVQTNPDTVLGIRYYIFGIPKKDIP